MDDIDKAGSAAAKRDDLSNTTDGGTPSSSTNGAPAAPSDADLKAAAAVHRFADLTSTASSATTLSPHHGHDSDSDAVDPHGGDLRLGTTTLSAALQTPAASTGLPANAPMQMPAQPSAAPAAPIPLSGVAVEIAAHAQRGDNRFDIRLDPPELGRIDVRLHFHDDGQVTSHLIVDRPDTLDLLQRDASNLQQSLQQTGLRTGDSGLQFSLRDQSFGSNANQGGRQTVARIALPDLETSGLDAVLRSYTPAGRAAGIDIRV